MDMHVLARAIPLTAWQPSTEDYRVALKMLRDAVGTSGPIAPGWEQCIDAVIGFMESFTGIGAATMAMVAADVKEFAAIGRDVRHEHEQQCLRVVRNMVKPEAFADQPPEEVLRNLSRALRNGQSSPTLGAFVDHLADKVGLPVRWRPLLELPDPASLPDPRAPYLGETPNEILAGSKPLCGWKQIAVEVARLLSKPKLSEKSARKIVRGAGIQTMGGRPTGAVFVERDALEAGIRAWQARKASASHR
jgi:hypothetical protein